MLKEATSQQRRVSFAGLICWSLPRRVGDSDQQRFLSVYDSVKQALSEDAQHSAEDPPRRMRRAIRFTAPGRYFLGFIRR